MPTYRQTGTIPKKTPIIPRSLANSRETSPTRNGVHQTVRRLGYLPCSSPRRPERPPIVPTKPISAQKILQASREAENALADALVNTARRASFFIFKKHVLDFDQTRY